MASEASPDPVGTSSNRLPLAQSYWHATSAGQLREASCGSILREAAQKMPDKVALIDPMPPAGNKFRWTYAEILHDAERVARSLSKHLPAGAHVALFASNCPQWVIVQFGIALAGMVMVTVNPACRAAELAYILRQSRSCAIFHETCYRGVDMAGLIAEACQRESLSLEWIVSLDNLAAMATTTAAEISLPEVRSADFAMIQYTSGTTGYPKGVLLTHHSVTNTSRIMAEIKNMDGTTVNLSVAPLFHTGGCVGGVLACFQTGGTLVLMRSFDADSMLDIIARERVTYTFAVPTMLIALLAAQERQPRDIASLTMIFSGGSTVPVDIVRRTEREFGVQLIIGYGLTESSPAITHTRPGDSPEDISETIGTAIPFVDVKIVDPATGATLPVGVPGELCARGFNVMAGYFDMPKETAETIDAEGWLHTGDLCVMDARGYCRVTGRIKDMIIRGGENIYPREIEEILFAHPAIASVAVFGVPDSYWGEQVAAAIVLREPATTDGTVLSDFARRTLASHKVPKLWYALAELPLTPSGKIQKFRLSELAASGALDALKI